MKTVVTEGAVQVYTRAGVMGMFMHGPVFTIPEGTQIEVGEKSDLAYQGDYRKDVRDVHWDGIQASSGSFAAFIVLDYELPQAQLV